MLLHPPCQFDEIGNRKLLGTLREEGMFHPSEIAESRPQGVAQHLAALAERVYPHMRDNRFHNSSDKIENRLLPSGIFVGNHRI